MRVDYRSLPGSAVDRPFLDVMIGASSHRVSGLVDSGSVHGLFHTDVADAAEVNLDGAEERTIEHGPQRLVQVPTRFATVSMECGGHQWDAEIGFGDWVQRDWGLLGHEALFRWFTVTFFGADTEFEIEPIDR